MPPQLRRLWRRNPWRHADQDVRLTEYVHRVLEHQGEDIASRNGGEDWAHLKQALLDHYRAEPPLEVVQAVLGDELAASTTHPTSLSGRWHSSP